MAEGSSVVNFGDISKPATVLIEKISSAVGVLYEPRRIKKMAVAEAEAEKIKAISSLELTEIQQRGIDRLINQEERKQKNIESITAQAIHSLPNEARVDDLEEDWIAHFFDKCDKISDKEMQTLWSGLLSGEATKPGSFSKRTVDFVSSMDKKDAEMFRRLCQFTWVIDEPVPIIYDTNSDIYKKNGIGFDELNHLQDIGLITLQMSTGYLHTELPKITKVYYFGECTEIVFPEETPKNSIDIGKAIFTQVGVELERICDAEKNPEFFEYILTRLGSRGGKVSKAT
ncbi:DUF2806 domain-containing protein [Colwellia sp. E150_009]